MSELRIKTVPATAKDYYDIEIITKENRQILMQLERSEVRHMIQVLDNAI